MLEALFGNATVEKVLFYLLMNEKCYASELRTVLGGSLSSYQNALERLEDGGVVVSLMVGNTRMYQLNPRYPFLKELKIFLEKAYEAVPEKAKKNLYDRPVRRRPRKKGKSL